MARAEWREHQGKRYLYLDHSGTEQETLANLDRAMALLRESGTQDNRILATVEGAYGTAAVMEGLRKFAQDSEPYVSRRAAVGVKGIQKVLLLTYNSFLKVPTAPRATVAEALDYLTQA